jgi:DNA-binding MarR family transcriptional regulator
MPGAQDLPRQNALDEISLVDGHVRLIELLFFAYRDFTGDADALLVKFGFGRAHHRVLHFVNRRPGLTVATLLDILMITKQSLARVLKELIEGGFIYQVHGARDRRQRELHLSQKGKELTSSLTTLQARRISKALSEVGHHNQATIEGFLQAMVDTELRGQINAGNGDRHG